MTTPIDSSFPVRNQSRLTARHDSFRWNHYVPRDGDVVVATYPKCGTTWMEHILVNLIHQGEEVPVVRDVAPWMELRVDPGMAGDEYPVEEVVALLERQVHRRQIKTHLPLSCLPYHREVRYVVVGRDARDACVSLYSHERALGRFSETPTIGDYWREWIAKVEDNPAPSRDGAHPLFDFYQQWWEFRHLENVLLVHFSDLLASPIQEIGRVAGFVGVEASDEVLKRVREATSFSTMKANAETLLPDMSHLKGGAGIFINEGTNGRWREVLTTEDQQLYEAVASRGAGSACRAWLEARTE